MTTISSRLHDLMAEIIFDRATLAPAEKRWQLIEETIFEYECELIDRDVPDEEVDDRSAELFRAVVALAHRWSPAEGTA